MTTRFSLGILQEVAIAPTDRYRLRKQPKQQRAEETRRRILDAAAHIFGAYGYAAGTTNRIAEAAEVSIGSLYQYFPNKDAVLRALMQEHLDAGRQRISEALAEGLPADLGEALRVVAHATIDNHRDNPGLHRVLFEEAPRAPQFLAELHRAETALVEVATAFLRQHPDVQVADYTLSARVVIASIEGLVHRLITAEHSVDPELLEAEIVTLLTRYLQGPPSR